MSTARRRLALEAMRASYAERARGGARLVEFHDRFGGRNEVPVRSCQPALALALLAAPAFAQEPAPVYQQQQSGGFQFKADAFVRREWTQDVVTSTATDPLSTEDQSRWVFRLRPRVELGGQRFKLGVGGDFYYSNKDNLLPPAGATSLAL